ncbi:hypothetical protein [Mesorhizobium sp. M0522]|uniref:hypothetical protein n=1 Tax=Mesorhizobium sp. M0522 TaxID=2956958 RepID=UPI003335498F
MSIEYALEKFTAVTGMMATSSGRLQERLHSAYLTFHPVQERDFPTDEMKSLYREIMERLTVVKDPDAGYVPATLAVMSDDEAKVLADHVYDLYDRVRRHVEEDRRRQ